MRRLIPTARSFLTHSGQTAALIGVAVLAMAMAPAERELDIETYELPELPPVTAVAEPAGPLTRAMTFEEPVRGFAINSRFGMRRLGGEPGARMHKGVDIAAPRGTTVYSAAEGEIVRIGRQPSGYGNFIEMRHPNGMTSMYAHLSRIDVASGDRVLAGERIGLVGSTGYSTGPHLHFEVRRGGAQVNPSRVVGETFQVVVGPVGKG
ncbi:MAG: M23 family metallopeptidase [Alphaproteobacteria bacterium]|nr:M23 family metallopeptidase [Alphaproteobacteria bacterium]MBU2378374.1 M23 family metallopeptidase [Alphaproteobacteria bacterium]